MRGERKRRGETREMEVGENRRAKEGERKEGKREARILVRWKLVTHAGIDGFSRMIVFMRCSANNASRTVGSG